ncbi:MAG: hypothetical protein ABIA11_04185 [Patescibacteria group bacterium]
MFKNPREEDLKLLTDEELIQLREYIIYKQNKHAAHCIRLLRMGVEFLSTGQLNVFREDASELKDIKQGKWSLEKIKKEAEDLFALSREALVKSPLPPHPDKAKAEDLLLEIIKTELELTKENQ